MIVPLSPKFDLNFILDQIGEIAPLSSSHVIASAHVISAYPAAQVLRYHLYYFSNKGAKKNIEQFANVYRNRFQSYFTPEKLDTHLLLPKIYPRKHLSD